MLKGQWGLTGTYKVKAWNLERAGLSDQNIRESTGRENGSCISEQGLNWFCVLQPHQYAGLVASI